VLLAQLFGLGRNSSYDDVDRFARVLPGLVQRIRAEVGM
jgi:cysteine desulfurase